jgi:hypothetical protein
MRRSLMSCKGCAVFDILRLLVDAVQKVIMEFKGKDETHVNLAKGFKTFLTELQKYVKSFHTTGLAWNPRGGLVPLFSFFCKSTS